MYDHSIKLCADASLLFHAVTFAIQYTKIMYCLGLFCLRHRRIHAGGVMFTGMPHGRFALTSISRDAISPYLVESDLN